MMEHDLNRSVRLLEDALHSRSKIGTKKHTLHEGLDRSSDASFRRTENLSFSDLNLSLSNRSVTKSRNMLDTGYTKVDEALKTYLSNHSVTGSIIRANKPWEYACDDLFVEFLEVLQCYPNNADVLEFLSGLARCCSDTFKAVQSLKSKVHSSSVEEDKWLIDERNTWRLIFCLYEDRLSTGSDVYQPYFGNSELLCAQNLYERDNLTREVQLVIDWLECNAADEQALQPEIHHFTDKTIGWENTLHQLLSSDTIVFQSSKKIVSCLDPDVHYREKANLHDLDAEDDFRLCRKIFSEIRCGKLDEAQALCKHCGHPWRAVLLEGWRLYHDPNTQIKDSSEGTEGTTDVAQERQPTEGNRNRDLWKLMAWKYCTESLVNEYEKASVAAFCGCVEALLPVCKTWEDQLWAYLRTLINIRVESEVRDFVTREYLPMPQQYWDAKMSLDEVFEKLSTSTMPRVQLEANTHFHLVQKFIILDQIPLLLKTMEQWLERKEMNAHFLRFLAHLILFLKRIDKIDDPDSGHAILEAYVKCLMKMGNPELIPFYVATLNKNVQINIYAEYLENVTSEEDRRNALSYAEEAGLDVFALTQKIVENIRLKSDENLESLQPLTTDSDNYKISALDWILFNPDQKIEALSQCNALIYYFLIRGKVDAARLAFDKVPKDVVETILSNGIDAIPDSVHATIKEYISYQAYLDAHDAFNEWFHHFHHLKPDPPPELTAGANFTEKVAHEHRVAQHDADTKRWRMSMAHLAKTAKALLYNVLLFPDGGWLSTAKDSGALRSRCLPEVVLLMCSMLKAMGEHAECVQLANVIASEQHQLYKVYSHDKLEEFVLNVCSSSISLLEDQKDPWGNDL